MTLDGTRTYIVGRERATIIDPGPDDPAHLEALVEAVSGCRTVTLVVTHWHPDHAGGAERLGKWLGAPVRAFSPEVRGRGAVRDGTEIETDVGTLRVVETPGHTPDHISLLWSGGEAPENGALFAGDLFMGEGDTTLVAAPEGDLGAYLRSLDRVEALAPEVIYPAHGPPITDPAEAVARYRAHRGERIAQVEAALPATGAPSLDELRERVYGPHLPTALRAAADGSLRAILDHLSARQ